MKILYDVKCPHSIGYFEAAFFKLEHKKFVGTTVKKSEEEEAPPDLWLWCSYNNASSSSSLLDGKIMQTIDHNHDDHGCDRWM